MNEGTKSTLEVNDFPVSPENRRVRDFVYEEGTLAAMIYLNTLRTGLLNCLNARSRGLNFRHRASCI